MPQATTKTTLVFLFNGNQFKNYMEKIQQTNNNTGN